MNSKPPVMDLRALVFDFGGVLVHRTVPPRPDSVADRVESLISSSVDDEQSRQLALERFDLTERRFERILVELVDLYEPDLELWEMLPDLRQTYRLGVINNGTNLTKHLFEERLRMSEHFDVFLVSAVEGISKPDPRIYHRASRLLGAGCEHCLFMDDKVENVEGALGVGMHAFLWEHPRRGRRLLREYIS